MSVRFYVNLPLAPGPFTLDGPEVHHLATVCRLRPGAEVCLFNGDRREFPAGVAQVGRREIGLEILVVAEPARELPFTLEVAAPLPKGDRCQFLIEKLTELGVTTFVPLMCARSNTQPREAKRDKLERHVIEASKQCGRNVLMKIDDLTEWESYACREDYAEVRIVAHPHQADGIANLAPLSSRVCLAVGPEGGFTDAELALALQHRWHAASLGPRILRIETAALFLVSVLTRLSERQV